MTKTKKEHLYAELCSLLLTPRAEIRAKVAEVVATAFHAQGALLFLLDYTGTSMFCAACYDVSALRQRFSEMSISVDTLRGLGITPALIQKNYNIILGLSRDLGIEISGGEYAQNADVALAPLFRSEDRRLFGLIVIRGVAENVFESTQAAYSQFLDVVGTVLCETLNFTEQEARLKDFIKQQRGKDLVQAAWRSNPSEKINQLFPGNSYPMEALRNQLARQAVITHPLLLLGARGTRKEEAAAILHRMSIYRSGRFVHMDCAQFGADDFLLRLVGKQALGSGRQTAAAAGFLREAQRGVLLLTNADYIPKVAQGALLRLLEQGKYRQQGGNQELDFVGRVIFTTDLSLRNFHGLVEEGRFDPVLFSVMSANKIVFIGLDTLGPDFDLTVQVYLQQIAREREVDLSISREALALLASRRFPGHYKQLNAVLQGVAGLLNPGEKVIFPRHIAHMETCEVSEAVLSGASDQPKLRDQVEIFERAVIERVLQSKGGNRAEAAAILGIPKRTLADRCKKYAL